MAVIEYNNTMLDVDMLDVDFADKYENSIKDISKQRDELMSKVEKDAIHILTYFERTSGLLMALSTNCLEKERQRFCSAKKESPQSCRGRYSYHYRMPKRN